MTVGQLDALDSQLVEELVDQGLGCASSSADYPVIENYNLRQPGSRRVLEKLADEGDCHLVGTWSEDLVEGVGFDLRELMLHVLLSQCLSKVQIEDRSR
jgi:hypothetical protein